MSAAKTPLAAAIRDLRVKHGSHDKLAKAVGTTRMSVIRWEQGTFPRDSVDELRRLGIPDELLAAPQKPRAGDEPVEAMREALANQREMRKDLERLSRAVADLARGLEEVLRLLRDAAVPAQPESRRRRQPGA